ncbi:PREDICTED: NADH dehydrogenase [ubiquinone] 1 beta subcomplex subunit 3 [Dufourea novaeangliae]|uniref:NADH dehydrogenase [ubiquinone] 1 beta subcomplex subunit 3 n=1 Tax=Dufourea novaeangliae TaxID=178035 RepID=A0A154PPT5_DUFNO|nr:PREDICTED: NADH dehydrogenase [ubiquinone] 1 beta subcomplex subunit 3 [Dufourea novaeangliae]KZC13757.1 NADH dehydrogenase [ubiquinone] 1 beta subcomplex subunit 3 [Dufourea novaeangliae]
MGGDHGHGLPKIPSPDIYKVENVPILKNIQEELAKKGLSDPWLRNEVWRYQNLNFSRHRQLTYGLLRGVKFGLAAFLITIGIEKYYGIDYGHGHGHGHDENHDNH